MTFRVMIDKVLVSSCHCGKDGHALNSVNCPVHAYETVAKGTTAEIETLRFELKAARRRS